MEVVAFWREPFRESTVCLEHELGRRFEFCGQYEPSGSADGGIVDEGRDELGQPVSVDEDVVVGEGNDLATSYGQATVVRGTEPGLVFTDVSDLGTCAEALLQ